MKLKGFSLIEMLIALLILSIIIVLASASYVSYVKKSRRIDAVNTMLSISLAQERYRAQNTQYGSLAQVWSGVTASDEGYYSLAISNVSATSYTITATAQGNQANDSEDATSCAVLTLAMSSGTITKSPTECWPN